jgi:hypothetical protein
MFIVFRQRVEEEEKHCSRLTLTTLVKRERVALVLSLTLGQLLAAW